MSTLAPGAPRGHGNGDRPQRTCVGCGRRDHADAMIRLIVAPDGQVGVDLAGGRFGRGAHLHTTAACLAKAPRGLSRAFHQTIKPSVSELAEAIQTAVDRRVSGLIASAVRARQVDVGGEAAGEAFAQHKARLLVIARDAMAATSLGHVARAIAQGGAVAWGTKQEIGSLVGRAEAAVLGIESERLAAAVKATVSIGHGMGTRAERQAPRSAMATEDR